MSLSLSTLLVLLTILLIFATLPLHAAPLALPATPSPTLKDGLAAAAIAAGLFLVDGEVQRFAQRHRGNTSEDIAVVVTPFGDGRFTVPALAVCYTAGYVTRNDRLTRLGMMGVQSFALAGAVSSSVKFLGHRARPSAFAGTFTWGGPSCDTCDQSFPSGHTTSAFAVATIVAGEFREKKWVAPVAYSAAALTGLARIHDNAHWASDVAAGAAVGYLSGRAVLHWNGKKGAVRVSSNGAALQFAF
jgi:membrane-associated phospholipid phosphatase